LKTAHSKNSNYAMIENAVLLDDKTIEAKSIKDSSMLAGKTNELSECSTNNSKFYRSALHVNQDATNFLASEITK